MANAPRSTSDQALKERVLEALQKGYSKGNLHGRFWVNGTKVYVPGQFVICRRTLRKLMEQDLEFAQEASALMIQNASTKNREGLAKAAHTKRSMQRCASGAHLLADNNVGIDASRGARFCKECRRATALRGGRPLTAIEARRAVSALQEGATVTDITTSGRPGYIVSGAKLRTFRRSNVKFDRLIMKLSRQSVATFRERRWRTVPEYVQRTAEQALAEIHRSVPSTLPYAHRQDVISSMALAYVEGRLRFSEIPIRVREFVSGQWRQFSNYGPVSLDRPLFEDSGLTLGDTVTRGFWG
jgi:hypothetical protein